MEERVKRIFEESISVKERFLIQGNTQVVGLTQMVIETLEKGGKILIFGNGGSAADAQHIAAEFVNRFKRERHPLAALALTTDSSILTSIGNDYGYEFVFVKQIEALGKPGDMAWGISTSGNSLNVNLALKKAREMGLKTVALTGGNGGRMIDYADLSIIVPSFNTPRIQEVHITIAHVVCELTEEALCKVIPTR